ncbi:hypothetical protein [Chitiniphilus eburneus]|uniref:Uncharacterized protein n=1 Tax=Chitiniphilus eburneus TaxID=2571148 RepID=A0A4U0P729_9NEIS|nr:hypothetical protein [Chitiniphilus eburneus]TJZ62542.1 hypothetical protein FAZ21_19910 [Chitiniphilus eburneus]
MATVTLPGLRRANSHAAPYGNAWAQRFTLIINGAGCVAGSDQATVLAIGDVVRIGWLPAGIELHDCLCFVSTAFKASTTLKLGFLYEDGADSVEVPQDDDYFHAALDAATTGRQRADNTAVIPVRLPRPAYLVATVGGAAQDAAARLDVVVQGLNHGNP